MAPANPALAAAAGSLMNLTPNTIVTIATEVRAADPDVMNRKGRKVPEFSSTNFEDWQNWREMFQGYVLMNKWSHARAREELNTSITGEARRCMRGIRIVRLVPPDNRPQITTSP